MLISLPVPIPCQFCGVNPVHSVLWHGNSKSAALGNEIFFMPIFLLVHAFPGHVNKKMERLVL